MSPPQKTLRVTLALALAACASGVRTPEAVAPPTPAESEDASASERSPSREGDAAAAAADAHPDAGVFASGPCPTGMVWVQSSFCIDAFEASLVEVNPDGSEVPFPNYLSPDGKTVRAVSVKGAIPQTFISEVQAAAACEQSGKRLCRWQEWKTACEGSAHTAFPYGATRTKSLCNDSGKNPVAAVFPELWATALKNAKSAKSAPTKSVQKKKHPTAKKSTKTGAKPKKKAPTRSLPLPASKKPANVSAEVWTKLNDPRLGQVEGTVARTGSHEQCVNDFGAFDMVGNVHEWVATDLSLEHGTFAGGYFLDTSINGEGCHYATRAHAHDYHDYSTGFRCCADP